jgi:hypothetical protein
MSLFNLYGKFSFEVTLTQDQCVRNYRYARNIHRDDVFSKFFFFKVIVRQDPFALVRFVL